MIAILGESGSGKSALIKEFIKRNPSYRNIVLYTTRPERPNEEDGVDYHFVSEKTFGKLMKNGFLFIAETYKGWHYGIPTKDCKSKNTIGAITPSMLRTIKRLGVDIKSIYLYVDRRHRLMNILARGDDIDEACRRNLSDVGQYYGVINETDYVITNTEFHMSLDETVTTLKSVVDTIEQEGE